MSEKVIYIAKNIRFLRKKQGLRQEDLATRFKKTYSAIGAWETGKNSPPVDMLVELSTLFNVGIEDLLFKNLALEEYKETQDNVEKGTSLKETVELLRFQVAMYKKHIKEKAPELAKELGIDSGG